MKFLKCLLCGGEIAIIQDFYMKKTVKCLKCGYNSSYSKEPEIIKIVRKHEKANK